MSQINCENVLHQNYKFFKMSNFQIIYHTMLKLCSIKVDKLIKLSKFNPNYQILKLINKFNNSIAYIKYYDISKVFSL